MVKPTVSLIHPIPFAPCPTSDLGVSYISLSHILTNNNRHLLTPDVVDAEGFTQWWHPTDTLWGFFTVKDLQFVILMPKNWDGGWDGRFGTIIDMALARDRAIIKGFFERIEPLTPIRGEAVLGWQSWVDTTLVQPLGNDEIRRGVILTRYKDNTYMFFVNVPEAYLSVLRLCVFCHLGAIYGSQ